MVHKTSTITNIISPAMKRHLREIDAPARFLLFLRPGVTKLDFIPVADTNQSGTNSLDEYQRVMDQAFDDALERIKQQGPQYLHDLRTLSLFELCHEVVTAAQGLAPHLQLDEQHVRAVAVRWLEQESLSLGDVPNSGKTGSRWRITPNKQAHLRFQDAIDWYAEHKCELPNPDLANDDRYRDYEELGVGRSRTSNTILKIPNSANRPNMVKPTNLKVFLAEHLFAYHQYAHSRTDNRNGAAQEPGLTFFFLPMKGLGQFRAAIDWVGIDFFQLSSHTIRNSLLEQASTLQRLGLESLFTQSLIRSFSTSLRQAFSDMQEGESKSSDALYQAFADLWWANEVHFSKVGQLQNRLIRAEGEDDSTWVTATEKPLPWNPNWSIYGGSFKNFLATAGNGHPELTYIKLNLSSLANPVNHTDHRISQLLASSSVGYRDLEKTINALPFDEVVFACYFFQPLAEDLAEWVDQLGDSVASILIEQTVQRTKIVRSRAKTLERAAHWLNGVMRSVGRVSAMESLEAAVDLLGDNHQSLESLRRVSNSLQLMVLVEACTGLLRLYGTIDEGDYAHLSEWFDQSSRAEWKTPAAFEIYQKSISHLVHAIGRARGHNTIHVLAAGKEIENGGNYTLDLDEIRFPPLSKAEKINEPILALLPALTEPLDNTFKYLEKNGSTRRNHPIRIEIEDRRQTEAPSILVNIGNPYFEDGDLPSTPGLVRAQELMEFTGLATIGTGEIRKVDGQNYYFVPVLLHPHRLAEKIDKLGETDEPGGWLCL